MVYSSLQVLTLRDWGCSIGKIIVVIFWYGVLEGICLRIVCIELPYQGIWFSTQGYHRLM